jgi:hypothetical protein
VVLKLGQFGNWIGNNWEVLKCGAGEVSCTDRVRNGEVLKRVKEERKILQTKRRKAN